MSRTIVYKSKLKWWCGGCQKKIEVLLPVEPLYEVDFVATLIPLEKNTLLHYVKLYPEVFPQRWRLQKRVGNKLKKVRVFTAEEVRLIRDAVTFETAEDEKFKMFNTAFPPPASAGVEGSTPKAKAAKSSAPLAGGTSEDCEGDEEGFGETGEEDSADNRGAVIGNEDSEG